MFVRVWDIPSSGPIAIRLPPRFISSQQLQRDAQFKTAELTMDLQVWCSKTMGKPWLNP